MNRKNVLALGAATGTLASIGCRSSSEKSIQHLSQTYLVTTDNFPEVSYITGYDKDLAKATSTALDVSGLGITTSGYARIGNNIFIPISGGFSRPDNRLAQFNTETQDVAFISCEYAPADVSTSGGYLYVAHNGSQQSIISMIRADDGATIKKTSLDGFATRIFVQQGSVYVLCDRLITPPNASQTIYLLDQNLNLQQTLTHPYSYLCIDVIQRDDSLIIANNRTSVGVANASSLIALHTPSGSIEALAAPPSTPVQFLKDDHVLYLACESGDIVEINQHYRELKKTASVKAIFGAYLQKKILFYLESNGGPLYAVDLVSKHVLARCEVPHPKYQSAAMLVFPRNI